MERLALPEAHYVGDIEIDSNNLLAYLRVSEDAFFRGKTCFAPELDLEMIEPYLRETYMAQQLEHVFTEEERTAIHFPDLEQFKHPVLRDIETRRQAMWKKFILHQEPVERCRSIYRDKDDGEVKISDIVYGQYSRIEGIDTISLFKRGHTPLFEIHSHPTDSMFSEADYLRLILNATKNGGMRILRGAILICPNIQLLALATPNTLFIKPNEVDKFIDRYDLKHSEAGAKITDITMKLISDINGFFIQRMHLAIKFIENTSQEEGYNDRGLYAEDEYREVIDRIGKKYATDTREALSNLQGNSNPKTIRLISERSRLYNQVEWEIAREVNPALYLATDFRHFKKFTV